MIHIPISNQPHRELYEQVEVIRQKIEQLSPEDQEQLTQLKIKEQSILSELEQNTITFKHF